MKPLRISVIVARTLSAGIGNYPAGSTLTNLLQRDMAEKANNFSQCTAYYHAQGCHAYKKNWSGFELC